MTTEELMAPYYQLIELAEMMYGESTTEKPN